MEEKISQEELDERVAVLRRLRTLLEQQREKFRQYLKVLELQETKIEAEDSDAILAHTELESKIMEGIGSLQKAIVPMQALYRTSGAASFNPAEAVPVEKIQGELSRLQQMVFDQNEKNRELLKIHMTSLRVQIDGFKNPYKGRQSVYAKDATAGTRLQIEV